MPRVRDLLDRQVAGSFVGRTEELNLLHDILADAGPVVVHLHGIAGIGKSRLLGAFIQVARAEGAIVLRLDCRAIEPTEAGLLSELATASGGVAGPPEEIAARLGRVGAKIVVALDTYEVFRLMDTWLRQAFLPMLPDNVRFILCGREAPVTAWLSDPGWHGLFRSIRLESLERRDSAELLFRAGVAKEDAKSLAGICHGHPLALTLAAAVRHTERIALTAGMAQRVVEEFSRLFLTDVTDPQTRRALEAASVVRRVTLPILSAMLPDASPQDAQERIRALPFVQPGRDGLHIHDAVREAIAATLRADNPQQYHAYRRSSYRYFMTELPGAPASDLWRYTADLLYLLENPVVREAFFPSSTQEYSVEPARIHDAQAILDIIDRHEDSVAACYMRRWWTEAPETFAVARARNGSVAGFYCVFDPGSVPGRLCGEDPVTRAWLNHLDKQPLPRQQRALFLRRWFSAEDGEAPSPVQAACWVDVKRKYLELRPNLRRVYLTVRDLKPYAAAAAKLGFRVLAEAGGDGCHSAMLDFGPSSVDGWLGRLVAAELGVEEDGLLDCAARELVLNGRRVGLTRLEFGVLEFLQRRVGEAVPRSSLLACVWEQNYDGGGNVVDVVIRGLRKKLGEKASLIQTVHGVGYRLRRENTSTKSLTVHGSDHPIVTATAERFDPA
ncbi:MAG TPA: winged helix-turn-helix domain-containing protein [Bryobacteraceae bacterium]|jgi:DNA-binding winged helix-turn-helix (wHTH) protein|nr:winged helix-turn-helix domain-containing protein [Bryobacteraceae bacterium]